jgi:hypothetical protein
MENKKLRMKELTDGALLKSVNDAQAPDCPWPLFRASCCVCVHACRAFSCNAAASRNAACHLCRVCALHAATPTASWCSATCCDVARCRCHLSVRCAVQAEVQKDEDKAEEMSGR